MFNYRVSQLSNLLQSASTPIWVEARSGVAKVTSIRQCNFFSPTEPDITLMSSGKTVVGEFPDQRVKLDLDHMRLEAKDVRGELRTILFGPCAPTT